VADFTVTDDALGTYTVGLTGADAGQFEIVGNSVFLKAGVNLNADTKPSLTFAVTADDPTVGASPDATSAPVVLAVTPGNRPPSIALANVVTALTFGVNAKSRVRVADIQVTDDNRGVNNRVLGGADAALFEIVNDQLFLKAGAALDPAVRPQINVTVSVDDPAIGTGVEATASLTIGVSYPTGQKLIEGATSDMRLVTTARALDEVCTTFASIPRANMTGDQASLFDACLGLTLDAQRKLNINQALNAVRPEEAFAASDAAFTISHQISDALYNRMSSGTHRGPVALAGLQLHGSSALATVAASLAPALLEKGLNDLAGRAGLDQSKWGVFLSGYYNSGDRSASAAAGSLDFDGLGVTLGADYKIAESLFSGLAISYAKQDGDFDNSASRIRTKGFSGSAYAALDADDWKVDAQLTAGQRNYRLMRQVAFTANGVAVDETARASFDGVDVTAGLRVRLPVLKGSTSLEVLAGATAILSKIDSYQETGAKGFNLFVDDQSNHFVYGELGLKAQQAFKTDFATFAIRLDGLYTLESGEGSRDITAGFVADPLRRETIVLSSADDKDRDFFSLGVGFTARLEAGWALDAGYRTILGLRHTDLQLYTLGVRSRF
jgi:outer membrane autotransporter protein